MTKTEELLQKLARYHFRRFSGDLKELGLPHPSWEEVTEEERQSYLDEAKDEAKLLSDMGCGFKVEKELPKNPHFSAICSSELQLAKCIAVMDYRKELLKAGFTHGFEPIEDLGAEGKTEDKVEICKRCGKELPQSQDQFPDCLYMPKTKPEDFLCEECWHLKYREDPEDLGSQLIGRE